MIYLIDASVYVFRAYFSIPDSMTDPQGAPVNALYGFARFLTGFLGQTRPTHVAVAFDESLTTSFRNELFPDYKANRPPAPEDLRQQFARCRDLTRALGLAEFGSQRYEADDIIGALACRARDARRAVTVVSRDKDLAQLLRQGDEYWDYASNKRYRYEEIASVFGVLPERMADFLALTGDTVDNIPGVPGVGKKTAAALLGHFDSLDDIYARPEEIESLPIRGAGKLAQRLLAHRETAMLARQLTVIDGQMPMDAQMDDLVWQGVNVAATTALYDAAGFGAGLRSQTRALR